MLENPGSDALSVSVGASGMETRGGQREPTPGFLRFLKKNRAFLLILSANLVALFLVVRFHELSTGHVSLLVMLAIFAAAMASSVAGFAFSAICGAFLFHLLGRPVDAVEIMMFASIAIQLLSVIALNNAIEMQHLGRFLLGGGMGLPIGIFLLTHIAPFVYLKVMGLFLIVYGGYMLIRRPVALDRDTPLGDCLAGFLGGVTGGFAAFPGAFVTIWCGLKGWNKDQQRGVYQPFILIMQVLALASLYAVQAVRAPQAGFDLIAVAYVPAALLGTWCGIAVYRRLTELQFARAVNLLLVVSGFGLIA